MPKVIVIGGGLAGISVAYELVRRGFAVTLYESREGVALETSYANGGLLTPSMADPWNAPGIYKHLLTSFFDSRSAVTVRLSALPSLLGWGQQFLRHSTVKLHDTATRASFLLGQYSVAQTRALRDRLHLAYDAGTQGSMKLFCDRIAMDAPLALARRLEPLGLRFEVLGADGAVAREPALADIRQRIAGAVWFPDDESGDAQQFCERLEEVLVSEGGRIEKGARVTHIVLERGAVSGIRLGDRVEDADIVVVAAGNSSALQLRPLGIELPIRPAKGYTLSFDASKIQGAPSVPIIDDELHAAIVPIGPVLRVAGTAEFAGYNCRIDPKRIDNLSKLLQRLMPKVAAQLPPEIGRPWAGLRPMSADGLPFIGRLGPKGLYVNSGHGHLGWTFAVGSARLLGDVIEDKAPDIDAAPYHPGRQIR